MDESGILSAFLPPFKTMSTTIDEKQRSKCLEAFRLITKILGDSPGFEPLPINASDTQEEPEHDVRQELRLMDAFARLAIYQHDVVAVVSAIPSRKESIGPVTSRREVDPPMKAEASSSKSTLDELPQTWNLVFARNDSSEKESHSGKAAPVIIDVKQPADFQGGNIVEYLSHLEKNW